MSVDIIPHSELEIYTISQLTQKTRQLLERSFLSIWIQGELSNVSQPSSGHVYFTLKDEKAQVRCALFRMNRQKIPFAIENGKKVVAYAKVSLYEPRGDFQLIISHLEEAGSGLLQKQFEQLKQKLFKEGLFDQRHKQSIPQHIRSLGVITSNNAAALIDVLHIQQRRNPTIEVIIYPSLVQGQKAATQLIAAIELANQRQECDLLLLTRGGGSIEDLWCFNDEALARAIFASELPIVSAIGHEIDFTIADFVADLRAATPSAGAELLSYPLQTLITQLKLLADRLNQQVFQCIETYRWRLKTLKARLKDPITHLNQLSQHLDRLEIRCQRAMQQILDKYKQQLHQLAKMLTTLNPANILELGYAIITDKQSGHIITLPNQTAVPQQLIIELAAGNIYATTTEKTP